MNYEQNEIYKLIGETVTWIYYILAPYMQCRNDDHRVQNKLRVNKLFIYARKQMQFAVANPFTCLLLCGNMIM